MKTRFLAFAALLSVLCSCAGVNEPVTPPPAPHPSPGQFQGPLVILEKGTNGEVLRQWEVKSCRYWMFPPTVEFVDSAGNAQRVTGSFQIVRKP